MVDHSSKTCHCSCALSISPIWQQLAAHGQIVFVHNQGISSLAIELGWIILTQCTLDAGDQIGHMWWRMLNGQLPSRKHPKAVVILIGTNDLTADDCRATEEASLVAAKGIVGR